MMTSILANFEFFTDFLGLFSLLWPFYIISQGSTQWVNADN